MRGHPVASAMAPPSNPMAIEAMEKGKASNPSRLLAL